MKLRNYIELIYAITLIFIITTSVIIEDYKTAIIYGVALLLAIAYVIMWYGHKKLLEIEKRVYMETLDKTQEILDLRIEELEYYKKKYDTMQSIGVVKATNVSKEEIPMGTPVQVIPFAEETKQTDQIYICPECGKEMTRQTEKIAFCDNIECSRKQFRKDKLK